MPGFNRAKRLVILSAVVIIMNSCVSSQKVTTTKKIPKTTSATKLTEEKAPALEVPSYPENVAFSEVLAMPEYIVGPGDVLKIIEWKSVGLVETKIKIRPDGKISFSFLEDIKVDGLTPTQIDDLITGQLEGFVKNPRIDVLVNEYFSKKASLFGEVRIVRTGKGPDVYPIKGKVRILDFLLEAGGPTDMADLKRVELTRHGKLYTLNLRLAFQHDDLSQNILMEAGDRVLVPKLPQFKQKQLADNEVYVFGEVNSPGKYSFAGKGNIVDVISRAGGLKRESGLSNINIIRGTDENPEVISVNFNKLLKKYDLKQKVPILDGDIVYVPKTGLDKVKDLVAKINPILSFILANPARFREDYTTGGGLRMDTDVDEKSLREFDRLQGFSGSNP